MYIVIQASKEMTQLRLMFTEALKRSHTCISVEKPMVPLIKILFFLLLLSLSLLLDKASNLTSHPKCWDYTMPSSLLLAEKQLELIVFKTRGNYDLRMKKSLVSEACLLVGEV